MRTRGWSLIRLEFAVATVAVGLVALLLIGAPSTTGGDGRGPLDWPITWLGISGIVVGFAAMIRIARGDPEAGPSSWLALRAR